MNIVERFKIPHTELEIFSSIDISSEEKFLFNLELYKIAPRQLIVQEMREQINDLCEITEINRDIEFASIEQKYNVIIDKIANKTVCVICKIFSEVNRTAISIQLSQYDIIFSTVTAINYLELSDTNLKSYYDPDVLFKRIILEALNLKATDVHFSVQHTPSGVEYPVQYRLGSNLYKMDLFKLDNTLNTSIVGKFIEHKTNNLALDISNSAGITTSVSDLFESRSIELRVSANSVLDGYRCVIRIQERSTTSLKIEQLGFAQPVTEGLFKLASKTNGITFITGAIRTGKNTTAFAMANEMINKAISIISYDSPVEVLMPFPQVDYGEDPEKLLNCVRLAKKQDVDIAFLNELPSKQVAFAVGDLVNSSVGVITTIHLDRLWNLPYRLYEYYGDSYKDIISQINGVVNQKMFNVLCPECRKPIKTYEIEDESIREYLEELHVSEVFTEGRCNNCYNWRTQNSGYVIGRNQPVAEFLLFTDELKETLLRCKTTWEMSDLLKQEIKRLNQSMEVYLIEAIKAGILHWSCLRQII